MQTPSNLRPRKRPVTIIVGIKCKGCIVLASDSQITYGNSKQLDGEKIEAVYLSGMPVLVAQSGDVAMSGRFVDIFREEGSSFSPRTAIDVAIKAQDSMRKLRAELRAVRFGCSSDELNESLRKAVLECEVMIGFYMGGQPHIYTVNVSNASYVKSTSYYDSIGCGGVLGRYLLAELTEPSMDPKLGALSAIQIIETVKKHDAFCGGQTRVSMIANDISAFSDRPVPEPVVKVFDNETIKKAVEALSEIEIASKGERLEGFKSAIEDSEFSPLEVINVIFD